MKFSIEKVFFIISEPEPLSGRRKTRPGIEVFKREWKFQTKIPRMKFSSENGSFRAWLNVFFSCVRARLIFFDLWALSDRNKSEQIGVLPKTRSANRNKSKENGEIGTSQNKSGWPPSADPKSGALSALDSWRGVGKGVGEGSGRDRGRGCRKVGGRALASYASPFERPTNVPNFLGCTPKGSYGNTALKKGSENVLGRALGKGSEKGACYGFYSTKVLRRVLSRGSDQSALIDAYLWRNPP